jgi:ankyrin repeat protein
MNHIVLNKNLELFKLFLKYDYPINEPMPTSYLVFEIIAINWIDGLKALIPYHPNLFITDCLNNTVLHYSVSNCNIEMITLLLNVVDPSLIHKVNNNDYSPLAIACIRQHVNTVKLLLTYKANPNEISYRYNRSILMSSAMWSTLDVIIVLLQYGAKATTKIANKTVSDCCLYESNNNYKHRYLLEAEKIAGCLKETLLDVTSKLSVIDVPTFHIISPFNIHDLIHEIKMDEVACYVAIHEGEDVAFKKYRQGEIVCFSQVPIRCMGRSFGTRPIRKLLTSYLVRKHRFINQYTI